MIANDFSKVFFFIWRLLTIITQVQRFLLTLRVWYNETIQGQINFLCIYVYVSHYRLWSDYVPI